MNKIIQTIKQLGITENDLPEKIQDRIESLEELVVAHNNFVDKLESQTEDVTEEQEKAVEIQSQKIDFLDERISAEIVAFKKELDAKKGDNPPPPPNEKGERAPKDEKKGGFGWAIFGVVALVVTLGAVNLNNK